MTMQQKHSSATHAHKPHVLPLAVYLGVGATLLFLTAVTVAVAKVDFGHLLGVPHLNVIIAMIIATIKATLVGLFFMHLLYDSKIYMAVFLTALFALAIFISLTMFDTLRRADVYAIEGGKVKAQAAMYDNRPSQPHAGAHHDEAPTAAHSHEP